MSDMADAFGYLFRTMDFPNNSNVTKDGMKNYAKLVELVIQDNSLINTITGIDKMPHNERYLEQLRRCGCSHCEREYRHEMQRLYDEKRHYDYYNYKSITDYKPRINVVDPLMIGVDMAKNETKKVEEPKNIAVKLLVDKLKAEQSVLGSNKVCIENTKQAIKGYQATLKEYNSKKLVIEKNIKELSTALKKLGHKE